MDDDRFRKDRAEASNACSSQSERTASNSGLLGAIRTGLLPPNQFRSCCCRQKKLPLIHRAAVMLLAPVGIALSRATTVLKPAARAARFRARVILTTVQTRTGPQPATE